MKKNSINDRWLFVCHSRDLKRFLKKKKHMKHGSRLQLTIKSYVTRQNQTNNRKNYEFAI